MTAQEATKKEEKESYELPTHVRVSNIIVRILYFWTIFGTIVLSLRVVLLAFSANPETRFVTFVYETSDRYLEPFRGIFSSRGFGQSGYLDVSALFAIIMYLLFLWGVCALINYVERVIRDTEQRSTKGNRS